MSPELLFGLVLFFAFVAWQIGRSRILLVMVVEEGVVRSVHGRAPADLIHDWTDIVRRAGCSATLSAAIERGAAVLRVRGAVDPGAVQRLRNVLGRFPLQRLRTAPKIDRDRHA